MQEKLPYYMAFPMPSAFGDDMSDKKDLEYLKSLYPNTVKIILLYVEEECDRLEYDGSMMYDEYPDQVQLHMICGRIYEKVQHLGEEADTITEDMNIMEDEMEAQHMRRRRRPEPSHNDPIRNIVQVLLFQEMMHRRCEHRRCKSRYY